MISIPAQDKLLALWIPNFVAFTPFLNPMNTHFLALGPNLFSLNHSRSYNQIPEVSHNLEQLFPTKLPQEFYLLSQTNATVNEIRQCLNPKGFRYAGVGTCNEPFLAWSCSSFGSPHSIAVFLLLWSVFLCPNHGIDVGKDRWSIPLHCLNGVPWSSIPCFTPYSSFTP